MKTDVPLKVLFRLRARDLLELTGDGEAQVLSTDVVEIQEIRRSVDFVARLSRDGKTYLRHLEFQAEPDPEMLERCFRYNVLLTLEYRVPVRTTVVYLFPPGPSEPPVFRVRLGGRDLNRWRFESLELWRVEARRALGSGAPGLLALVPLMKGGEAPGVIAEAGRRIDMDAPARERSDLLSILCIFAGRRYSIDELKRLVGGARMEIQSSFIDEYLAKGEAIGVARGELAAERELCSRMIQKYHPALAESTRAAIQACDDSARLKEWILAAADVDDEGFLRLLSQA